MEGGSTTLTPVTECSKCISFCYYIATICVQLEIKWFKNTCTDTHQSIGLFNVSDGIHRWMVIIELYTTQKHLSIWSKSFFILRQNDDFPTKPMFSKKHGSWQFDGEVVWPSRPPEFERQTCQQLLWHEETGKGDRESFSFFIICFGLVTTSMSKKKILHSSCVNALTQSAAAGTSWTQCPAIKKKHENYPLLPLK